MSILTGVLLAAGAGRRMGTPKALVVGADGEPWLVRGARVLLAGGCDRVVMVLGAESDSATRILDSFVLSRDPRVGVVVADDWADGMSASLRVGLAGAAATDADAALVSLVDLPGLPADAVRRMLVAAAPDSLRQATYGSRPGHPVLIGRAHWAGLTARLRGDEGARGYLREHRAERVTCGDLWSGDDIDGPGDPSGWAVRGRS